MKRPISIERINEVMRVDSISEADYDFFSTHVPMNNLYLTSTFDETPSKENPISEDEMFDKILLQDPEEHKFVVVHGQSGSGKSHLIRWYFEKFKLEKNDDQTVIFIQRGDNSLKGAIRQLLSIPEIQQMANREKYEQLVQASLVESEEKLKDKILSDLILEVEYLDRDKFKENKKLSRLIKDLPNYLRQDTELRKRLLEYGGPIQRIYSKIAGETDGIEEENPQFVPSDFYLPDNRIPPVDDGRTVKKMNQRLTSDERDEYAANIVTILNSVLDKVIKDSIHLKVGDFKEIFLDIRKELFRQNKSLVMFIEDVTTFSGVDGELIDVLIQDHKVSSSSICRICSIVGTTTGYLRNFKDNHKQRIHDYIYLYDDLFTMKQVYEFFARYLNTMTTPVEQLIEWKNFGYAANEIPVAEFDGEEFWESVNVNERKMSLAPFTKTSIQKLYQEQPEGHRAPRDLLTKIIQPVMEDILFRPDSFPASKRYTANLSMKDERKLRNAMQGQSDDEYNRVKNFIGTWGTGEAVAYSRSTGNIISGIPEQVFQEFNIPIPDFEHVETPNIVLPVDSDDQENMPVDSIPNNIQNSSASQEDPRLKEADELFLKWQAGSVDLKKTGSGIVRTLNAAIDDLSKLTLGSFDLYAEEISPALFNSFYGGRLFAFEGNSKTASEQYIYLKRSDLDLRELVHALVRRNLLNKPSWDYPEGLYDSYIVSSWINSNREAILRHIRSRLDQKRSLLVTIKLKILLDLFTGSFVKKSLNGYTAKDLLKPIKMSHLAKDTNSPEFCSMVSKLRKTAEEQKLYEKLIRNFNVVLGEFNHSGSGGISILDYPALSGLLSKAKSELGREMTGQAPDREDYVQSIGQNISNTYVQALEHLTDVIDAQKKIQKKDFSQIHDLFNLNEDLTDQVGEALQGIKSIGNSLNMLGINVRDFPKFNAFSEVFDHQRSEGRQIAAYMKQMGSLEEDDIVKSLSILASDPLSKVETVSKVLNKANSNLDLINNELTQKLAQIQKELPFAELEDEQKQLVTDLESLKVQIEGEISNAE